MLFFFPVPNELGIDDGGGMKEETNGRDEVGYGREREKEKNEGRERSVKSRIFPLSV